MIVLKYSKQNEARFISHIDLLRHVNRIIRRGGIRVNMSNGYNPHTLIYFSPPLALGIGSEAEYMAIDSPSSAREVFDRYNAAAGQTLGASAFFETASNPNLQKIATAADYLFDVPYFSINTDNGFIVKYRKKDQEIEEDVADKIYAIENHDGKLLMRLATGNVNLRPDRLLGKLEQLCGERLTPLDVTKLRQYIYDDPDKTDMDAYLKKLSENTQK